MQPNIFQRAKSAVSSFFGGFGGGRQADALQAPLSPNLMLSGGRVVQQPGRPSFPGQAPSPFLGPIKPSVGEIGSQFQGPIFTPFSMRPATPGGGGAPMQGSQQQFSQGIPTFTGGGTTQSINQDIFQPAQIGFGGIGGGMDRFNNLRDQQIQTFQGLGQRFDGSLQPDEEEERRRNQFANMSTNQGPIIAPQQIPGLMTRLPEPSVGEIGAGELTTPAPDVTETTEEEFQAQVEQGLLQKASQAPPIPTEPVVPTPEQSQFEQENPQERFNLDNARRTVGLPQMETQRAQTMQQMNDINVLFQEIIDDVKNNPELPKGLALRRINKIQESQKLRIMQLQGTLEILNQQIGDGNDLVDQQFGIAKFEASEDERRKDNDRSMFNILVSGGAIGGLSPQEISQWAQRLGVSDEAINEMKDAANDPKKSIITNEDANGNLTGVNKNTGEIVWSLPGFGKGAGGGVDFTDTQIAKGAINAGMSIADFQTLSIDEQNAFIQGKKSESFLNDSIDKLINLGIEEGNQEATFGDIRAIITATGFNADEFSGGQFKKGLFGGPQGRNKTILERIKKNR